MLEQLISDILRKTSRTWSLRQGSVAPDEHDVQAALDEAARVLYSEETGTRLEVGGLIIEKRPRGHDVYVYVGNYE